MYSFFHIDKRKIYKLSDPQLITLFVYSYALVSEHNHPYQKLSETYNAQEKVQGM